MRIPFDKQTVHLLCASWNLACSFRFFEVKAQRGISQGHIHVALSCLFIVVLIFCVGGVD